MREKIDLDLRLGSFPGYSGLNDDHLFISFHYPPFAHRLRPQGLALNAWSADADSQQVTQK